MNKQEVIEKIRNISTLKINDTVLHQQFDMVDKNKALDIISKINEPKKPVVPQFIADFYESIKNDFENKIYGLCADFYLKNLDEKIYDWFEDPKNNNKPIETLVMMHKFGYEVKKEKLYTVEIPNPNLNAHIILQKTKKGIVLVAVGNARWKGWKSSKLTEAEIKKDFGWAWQWAKEVEE